MAPDETPMSIPIISDHKVEQIDSGQIPTPNHWRSRRLYIRQRGAENWCNVVHHSSYPLQGGDPYDLKKNRRAAIDLVSVATMISLGPGDALHDLDIVAQLRINRPDLVYIPLDLSRYLLKLAIENLMGHVHIPAGLQCDFEQIPTSLKRRIADLSINPVLFSMFGGTVGNLDLGERHFFARMLNLMGKNDRFLIDVPLAGPGWTAERDPRFNKETYTDEFKQFIAFSLTKFKPEFNNPISPEAFEERIDCRIGKSGDLPNTKTVTIFDRPTNQVILRFCRYDWESIVSWLANHGFEILFHRCSLKDDRDIFGMGIIMLGLS